MPELQKITDALVGLNRDSLAAEIEAALEGGVSAVDILRRGLIPGMDVIGTKMETEEMFIPEVLKAAKLMKTAVERLQPLLADHEVRGAGYVVLGTVKGDLHDIGKNLVALMLQSVGYEIHDLGVDVAPERFVEALRETNAPLLGLSALLTTTTEMIQQTVAAVRASELGAEVRIMIGGAPVSREFAAEAGADGYAADAGAAVKLAASLLG